MKLKEFTLAEKLKHALEYLDYNFAVGPTHITPEKREHFYFADEGNKRVTITVKLTNIRRE